MATRRRLRKPSHDALGPAIQLIVDAQKGGLDLPITKTSHVHELLLVGRAVRGAMTRERKEVGALNGLGFDGSDGSGNCMCNSGDRVLGLVE